MPQPEISYVKETTSGAATYVAVTADPISLASLTRNGLVMLDAFEPLGAFHPQPPLAPTSTMVEDVNEGPGWAALAAAARADWAADNPF